MPQGPDNDGPLEARLPPVVQASAVHAVREPPGEITWWRPGWGDVLRAVGWRWVFLTPALGLVLLALASRYTTIPQGVLWLLEIKLLIVVVAIAISLAGFVVRRAVRARSEPFCIYCGYCLHGLPDGHRCPECGRPYTWNLIAEYRRDPQWFIERWQAQHTLPPAEGAFEAGAVARKRRARDGTE